MGNGIFIPMQGRAGPPPPPLPTHAHPNKALSGNGSPEGVVPSNPGTSYTDLGTNLIYLKIAGTQNTGWTVVGMAAAGGGGGGGGGGAGAFFSGVGSPVGVITPPFANAVYTDTATGNQWWWYLGSWH